MAEEVRVKSQLVMLQKEINTYNMPCSIFHSRLIRDVKMMLRDTCEEEAGTIDVVVLASKLSAVGYRVYLRSAIGGGDGVSCYFNLANEFLLVSSGDPSDPDTQDFLVEARFRDHFKIPQPTMRYEGLLEMVPEVVVATPSSLSGLVQLVCSEMALAFGQMGLSLPPWRQAKSLLSKWLPTRAKDYGICSSSSPRSSKDGGSPNAVTISAIPSGNMTPLGSNAGDSPRAVLCHAVAALTPHNPRLDDRKLSERFSTDEESGPTDVLSRIKRKSLLSETLAGLNVKPTKSSEDRSHLGSKCDGADQPGWLAPIRRVRMQGGSV